MELVIWLNIFEYILFLYALVLLKSSTPITCQVHSQYTHHLFSFNRLQFVAVELVIVHLCAKGKANASTDNSVYKDDNAAEAVQEQVAALR